MVRRRRLAKSTPGSKHRALKALTLGRAIIITENSIAQWWKATEA